MGVQQPGDGLVSILHQYIFQLSKDRLVPLMEPVEVPQRHDWRAKALVSLMAQNPHNESDWMGNKIRPEKPTVRGSVISAALRPPPGYRDTSRSAP